MEIEMNSTENRNSFQMLQTSVGQAENNAYAHNIR